MVSTLTLIQQEEEIQLQDRMEMENPLALFMYALRAPETRRQWPVGSKHSHFWQLFQLH